MKLSKKAILIPMILLLSSCTFSVGDSTSLISNTSEIASTSQTSIIASETTSGDSSTISSEVISNTSSEMTSSSNETENQATITLSDSGSTFSNTSYVTVVGSTITILKIGSYTISGKLSNGHIFINATKVDDNNEEVELIFNGVDITCNSGYAPIYSISTSKLKINKAENTVNKITDNRTGGSSYTGDDNAAIFSNKRLKIVGYGTLNVYGNFYNGVGSDKGIELKNGSLTISALNNGVKAHEDILINEDGATGTISVTSTSGNGIRSDEVSTDATEIYGIFVYGGTLSVTSAYDGLDSEQKIEIVAGNITVTSGGGSSTSLTNTTYSYKGIKATEELVISGGTINVNSKDDGIHSNGNITISNGTITVSSGDDGIHSDNELNISGGTITVSKSYEGIEGVIIDITGGYIYITSSDDGINAAGGSDTTSTTGGWGETTTTGTLYIKGGYIYIYANGDGVDSNGDLYISGGVIVVSAPNASNNGPVDFGDNNNIYSQTGGIIVAYGTSGMAVGPTSGTQGSALWKTCTSVSTSQYFVLTNSSGPIYAVKPTRTATTFLVSCPQLTANGGNYGLYVASAISGQTEVFKGLFTCTSYTTSSTITSSFSLASSLHYSTGNGGGGRP